MRPYPLRDSRPPFSSALNGLPARRPSPYGWRRKRCSRGWDAASTKSDAAKAATRAAAAAEDADTEANDEAEDGDNDAHGDAVSAVARSGATAAHENGKKKVNHGGAVSAVAHDHD